MKRLYSLYATGIVLILACGMLLSNPPTTVCAADCTGRCQYGSDIRVSGSTCSCTDNVGCTWTNSQGSFTQKCATKDTAFETEGPPEN